MDKKLLNEIKRIKQLMSIRENEVNEGMKDLMKAALLCTVLATGEIACKRPEEILPTEKSSDLVRNVDSNYTTKQKNYFNPDDIEEIGLPIDFDSIEDIRNYNPNRPWCGIWKLTYPDRIKSKSYFVWTSNGSNNILKSKFFHSAYVSDIHRVTFEYVIKTANVEKTDEGYLIHITYTLEPEKIPEFYGRINDITFLLYNDGKNLKVVDWGDGGYAIRMDYIPYR